MKTALVVFVLLVGTMVGSGVGQAGLPHSARVLMSHHRTVQPRRQLVLANQTVKHARDVLGFLRANPTAGTDLSRLRVRMDHLWLLRFGLQQQSEARARIRASAWPAHHLLWLCIHGTPSLGTPVGHEASSWSTRAANGHYGGLQMHPWWGYGTSEYASDDSQLVQEQAAERGLHAAGPNWRSWLIGQWGETIGPCWRYT